METTLLIMAAGIGSRFGGGIKQLEPVDDKGHIIMDYSLRPDLIKLSLLFAEILRKSLRKSSVTGLPLSVQTMV